MTAKRLFVGRKTVEDRFTIITDYEGEIGVKENRSGDVLVLKHSDLNAQQFVAQLVVFLNDQNQAIVDLYDGSKYWSDKATEKIKELEKENEQLKKESYGNLDGLNYYQEQNGHLSSKISDLECEKEQLKKTISMYSDATKSDMREIKELMQDIEDLQKENEQLKTQLNVFKPIIFEDTNGGSSILYEKVEE